MLLAPSTCTADFRCRGSGQGACLWGGGGESFLPNESLENNVDFPETAKWGELHALESENVPLIVREQVSHIYK